MIKILSKLGNAIGYTIVVVCLIISIFAIMGFISEEMRLRIIGWVPYIYMVSLIFILYKLTIFYFLSFYNVKIYRRQKYLNSINEDLSKDKNLHNRKEIENESIRPIIKEVRQMPDGNADAFEKKLLERLPEMVQKLADQRVAEIKLYLEKDYEKRLQDHNYYSADISDVLERRKRLLNLNKEIKQSEEEDQKRKLSNTEEYTLLVFSLAGMSEKDAEKVWDVVKLFIETGQVSADKDLCIPLNKKLRNAELKQFVTNIIRYNEKDNLDGDSFLQTAFCEWFSGKKENIAKNYSVLPKDSLVSKDGLEEDLINLRKLSKKNQTYIKMIESRNVKLLTIEEVQRLVQMNTIEDCKQYMKVMLDFYFDVFLSPSGRNASSSIENDRNLWLQTMFSKGCQFVSLLDGVGYSKGLNYLNPIIDFSVLFTIARSVYESLIIFELLFVRPKTEEQQTIVYNLFMAHGLSERLKDLDEDAKNINQARVLEEQKNIEECKKAIEGTELYGILDEQTKAIINNAFGQKYRYLFKDDNSLEFIKYENAYTLLNVKENLFNSIYSFFSLHGHPSYLSLIQFRDAFKDDYRADIDMAKHATQCVLSFMSIFIVDYMKINPDIKTMYDKLEEPRRFAIGMYEDAMRGEKKFQ